MGAQVQPAEGGRQPGREAIVLVSLLALLAWTGLARARVEPFWSWYYHFAWYTALVGLDAALALREGRSPLFGRPRFAVSLFLWSVPVWLVFEALNFRIANWYYVLATPDTLLRRLGTAGAFATVLPAIYLGHRWAASLLPESGRTTALHPRTGGPTTGGFRVAAGLRRGLFVAGVAFLALALWWPRLFFPLVWGAVTLLLEPWNHARDPDRSLLGDLSRGRWGRVVRLLLGGAAIGLVWELFNAAARTRWIYTVPGLEELKLFEMPVAGYLGFPVFALDCFVLYQALVGLRVAVPGWDGRAGVAPAGVAPAGVALRGARGDGGAGAPAGVRPGRTAAAAAVAAAFSVVVLAGIDRYTVDSWAADGDELAGLPPETARLASLRGLGVRNADALGAAGIGDACELARASPEEVAAAVRAVREDPHAGREARVRVWIDAAVDACDEGGRRGSRGGSEPMEAV